MDEKQASEPGGASERVRSRVFLGTDGPALRAAAERLLDLADGAERAPNVGPRGVERGGSGGGAGPGRGLTDLSRWMVVTPEARAGRTLVATLVDAASERGRALAPPNTVTAGELADALLGVAGTAGEMERRLAWAAALRATPGSDRRALLPHPPPDPDLPGWLAIADLVGRAHAELTAHGLGFADAAARLDEPEHAGAAERLAAAGVAAERYAAILAGTGGTSRDPGLERLRLLGRAGPGRDVESAAAVALVGVTELTPTVRRAIGARAGSVHVLIAADEADAAGFDELGCLDGAYWRERRIGLEDASIRVAGDPTDQADAAWEWLAERAERAEPSGGLAATDVSVAVLADEVRAELAARADALGVRVRFAGGTPVGRTAPGVLLALLRDLAREPTFASLDALVRHPVVFERVSAALGPSGSCWLEALDRYESDRLPRRLTLDPLGPADDRRRGLVGRVIGAVGALTAELGVPVGGGGTRPIGEWADAVGTVLARCYEGRSAEPESSSGSRNAAALEAIARSLDAMREACATHAEPVGSGDALSLLADDALDRAVPDEPDASAAELMGWLELALDPAPEALVVGVHDGALPGGGGADALLPERARRALGLPGADARLTRDAQRLSAIAPSRRFLGLVVGRRSADGDPLVPSRLLAMEPDPVVVRRLIRLTSGERDPARTRRLERELEAGDADGFPVRPVLGPEPITSLPVTAFGQYLRSPYGFYLRHVLRLREHELDAPRELGPAAFGTLVHEAMRLFGLSDAASSANEREVRAALFASLDDAARSAVGPGPDAPVLVQLELARARLAAIAGWQADRARDGWRIERVEWQPPEDEPVTLDAPGGPVVLTGRIDRIDRHAETGELALLDYKTGDRVRPPAKTHRRARSGEWTDLQLPLYRRLAASLGATGDATLGYVALDASAEADPLLAADWGPDDLASADEEARRIIGAARAGAFGEPGDHPPRENVSAWLAGSRLLLEADEDDDAGRDGGRR